MIYTDGNMAKVGDKVLIDKRFHGVVVVNIDGDEYAVGYPREKWSYLSSGVVIDTDFGGLVHYCQECFENELMELVSRE